MDNSRIPKFYKLSVPERLRILNERKIITNDDYRIMSNGKTGLQPNQADKIVENVIGVFNLPMGLGLNFLINGKDYIIPMVVEEPSIIAAVSAAAKLARSKGGFTSESTDPILIGQIQVVDVEHTSKAQHAILQKKEEILNLANSLHPKLIARGGGAKDAEVLVRLSPKNGDMIIVHLLVDTRDAMGANLVNSMCEGVASLIEKISGGKVYLRILSNLTDRSMVRAKCVIPVNLLEGRGFSGEDVRDGIVLASEFARVDPYRAATHNKGIMNGIDPVAIATGNDWRAIEAAAHAYAGRGKSYTSLTNWSKNQDGDLEGTIKIPLKVGIVGGPLESNPIVKVSHHILGITSATELAEVMGAVGLAQNLLHFVR
jgi:hydroxymethylglutaryl-CoA reductase